MDASVVICVDATSNPSALAGNPCPTGQGLVTYQAQLVNSPTAFDAAEASGFFFFGFGVIIFAYLLGFSVAQVRKPIRTGV